MLFHFISPALYENEKKYSLRVMGSGYAMFILGVLLSYFLIFPLTFRFLGTYQVSSDVANMITLQSYMGTLMMSILMGIVFELPVLCWLLGKLYRCFVDDFINSHRYIDCDNVVCRNCHEMIIHLVRSILYDYQDCVRKKFATESFSLEDAWN